MHSFCGLVCGLTFALVLSLWGPITVAWTADDVGSPDYVTPGEAVEQGKQEETDQKESRETEARPLRLDEVIIRGDALFGGLEGTSATVLDNAEIVDRVYVTPLDIVKLSPGVTISQYRQGGTAAAFQMRGFTGCSHGPDAAIFLDGVPLNETDGYADTNVIIPEEIERVELVKGPVSALYGNYASAGALAFSTYKSGDFIRLKARYGSYNTQDGTFVMARKDGRLDHVYAGQLYHTDGRQADSDWDKVNGAGRWTYHFTDQLDGSLGVRAFHSTWDAPGYIPEPVYESSPSNSVSDVNGGDKSREEMRADLRYQINDSSKLLFYGWGNQQDFTRYYQNWISPAQQPGQLYGDERFFQREVFGTGASYNYIGEVFGRDATLVVGLDWMREHENRERWNLIVGQGRNRGPKYQDYAITLYTTGLYAEAQCQLLKPLRFILGARGDLFSGELEEQLPSGTYDRDGPEIFSPKGGMIYSPIEQVDIFANLSRGFALPRGQDLWKRSYLDPAIRTQYELGVRARPSKWTDLSFVLWRLDTTDDFQPTLDDPTVLENAGKTRRQGIELGFDAYPWQGVALHADYAFIDTEYLHFVEGGVNRNGNRLTTVPEHVFNVGVSYEPEEKGWGGRVQGRWVSDWFIDAANTLEAEGFFTADAQISYRFNQRYRVALDVINVFDQKYAEYVGFANNVKTYAPADPFSAYVTLTLNW